jgi:TonB family protein
MSPLVAVLLVLAAEPPRHDLEKLLARPVSPGVVALLVPHVATDERAAARVLASIAHADPAVRAAAARLCYVYAVKSAVPALRAALAAETDRAAAVELIRAVALLGGTEAREEARAAAARHKAKRAFATATVGELPPPASPRPDDGSEVDRILVSAALPPGVLKDVLAVSGCRSAAGIAAIGVIDYRPDGRPRHVSVMPQRGLSRACEIAGLPALSLSLAPSNLAQEGLRDRRTHVFVPMDPTSLECGDDAEPDRTERPDSERPGSVREPKKVKTVNPAYPRHARDMGRQGTVVLEAVLAPSGCVRSVVLRKGVDPALDLAALRAVGQWRYTPTLLDGEPVNVIMTITVNFRLG